MVPSLKPSRSAIALFERPSQVKLVICCSRSDNPGRRSIGFLRSALRATGAMPRKKAPGLRRGQPLSSKLLAIGRLIATLAAKVSSNSLDAGTFRRLRDNFQRITEIHVT